MDCREWASLTGTDALLFEFTAGDELVDCLLLSAALFLAFWPFSSVTDFHGPSYNSV